MIVRKKSEKSEKSEKIGKNRKKVKKWNGCLVAAKLSHYSSIVYKIKFKEYIKKIFNISKKVSDLCPVNKWGLLTTLAVLSTGF